MEEKEEREEESVSIETTQRVKKVKFADMVEVDTDTANDKIKDKQSEQASSSIEHKVPNNYQEVCSGIILYDRFRTVVSKTVVATHSFGIEKEVIR